MKNPMEYLNPSAFDPVTGACANSLPFSEEFFSDNSDHDSTSAPAGYLSAFLGSGTAYSTPPIQSSMDEYPYLRSPFSSTDGDFYSSPSSMITPFDDFNHAFRPNALEGEEPWSADYRDPQQSSSVSPSLRRPSLQVSSLLSDSLGRELDSAIFESGSRFYEGPEVSIVASTPSTTSMPSDLGVVGAVDIDSDSEIESWDGFRKEGDKWFCEQCGVGVAGRKSDLKRHLAIHGEKKYVCEKGCGKRFVRRDAMRRHAKNCGLGLKRGPKPGSTRVMKLKLVSDRKPGRRPRFH